MKKLTLSLKNKITKQWGEAFPSLGVYKNMWLLRRVGPFVQGICLDKDSSNTNYLPIFHIHNLVNQDDDFISLTLRAPFVNKKNGVPLRITIAQHDERFSEYVRQFRTQIPFSLDKEISCDEIWGAFKNYIKNGQEETRYPLNQYLDMLCLLIWCDREDEARLFFEKSCLSIDSWPSDVTRYIEERINKFHSLKGFLGHRADMTEKVERVVENLGLNQLPSIALRCSGSII